MGKRKNDEEKVKLEEEKELNEKRDKEEILDEKMEENAEYEKEDVVEIEEEIDDTTKKLLRLQADFLNYKNRAEKEKTRIYTLVLEDTLLEMLPILDNFERAMSAEHDNGNFKDGIEMIFNQLKNTLEKKGLVEIDALGKKFDPNIHHAVASEEKKEAESEMVIEVFQKGYMINDKVIRPSMVKVSK
jgi:molecular chaperone GrpE